MENNELKIQVVIAARQYLYRLGVKTIISVLGVEPEIVEFDNYLNLYKKLTTNSTPDFVIINEDVIPEEETNVLNQIKELCPNSKLMIVLDKNTKLKSNTTSAVCLENQKEIVEKFQEFFFEPEMDDSEKREAALLSEREMDVLKCVAIGNSNKEIAGKLFISTNTVISHRKNITDKLGIKTIAGLTVYAIMNKLILPEEVMN